MPVIQSETLECVAYLYPDKDSAINGRGFGGCGFFVGVPSQTAPNRSYVYLVSNYHVVVSSGCSVVRVNLIGGGVDVFEFDPADWLFIENGGDVAIIKVPLDRTKHQAQWLPVGALIDDVWMAHFGVGADVFMMGRFIDHDGGQSNRPAARFGNISIMPTILPDTANSDESTEYFCLDMHSRSGFSGSPVVVYKTMGTDLELATKAWTDIPIHGPVMKLLGIHCGQFPESLRLKGGGENELVGYSGMTYALPAWNILNVLNMPKLVAARAVGDAHWKGVNSPCPE